MNEEEQWKKNADDHTRYDGAIVELHTAIYGGKNGDMGMKKQLEEMYSVFVPVTVTGRFIIKTIIVLGSIATAIEAAIQTFDFFRSHK